jgi:hypothetical protein
MIIQDKETTLETIGNIQDEAQFKMRTSQKAFQILSSLYSDKPLAIVRELGCNAMDSHIASGQLTRPFHVHIPNALEPWLTIQDFGTGISHENIYEIYSTYFASTKTNTNTQVGMLGLGSKSPFCYSDNFTITSIHDSVKRIYNAYFNQQGMPTISLASQENTTEQNGVAIQIPIKNSDIGEFTHSVFKAFRFFDVKPTISGGEVNWTDKSDFEGSFWKSYANKLNCSYAVMGGVTYPIDIYKMHDDHYDILRKAGLVINFNIGELDVTPSRESLMYHDWVVKALNDKVDLVKKDFLVKVEETIKSSPNLLDALKALYKLNSDWSFLNSSMIKGNSVKWNSIDITDPRHSVKKIAPDLVSYSKAQWGRKKYSESTLPQFHNNVEWYFDDTPRGAVKRVLQYIRKHSNRETSVNIVNQKDMKALIQSGFPASTFIPASTLPAVATNKASSGKGNSRPKGIINLYDVGYEYRTSWEAEKFDLATGTAPKYYIVKDTEGWGFDKSKLFSKDGKVLMTIGCKSSLKDYCKFAGINTNDVRMVSKNNAQHIQKLGSIPLSDSVKKKVVDVDWESLQIVKNISTHVAHELKKHKLFAQLSDTNPLKIFVDKILNAIKESGKLEHIKRYIGTDENFELTFPSNLVKLIYLGSENWKIGVEDALKAALEINNQ